MSSVEILEAILLNIEVWQIVVGQYSPQSIVLCTNICQYLVLELVKSHTIQQPYFVLKGYFILLTCVSVGDALLCPLLEQKQQVDVQTLLIFHFLIIDTLCTKCTLLQQTLVFNYAGLFSKESVLQICVHTRRNLPGVKLLLDNRLRQFHYGVLINHAVYFKRANRIAFCGLNLNLNWINHLLVYINILESVLECIAVYLTRTSLYYFTISHNFSFIILYFNII